MNDAAPTPPESFHVSSRNRLRRKHERGRHDRKSVYEILDAAMVCHIAYVIDGQPYCTPTAFWREGDHLYWHGSSASRMLRAEAKGIPVCLTVTHMDAVVLARCGFNHSINYRSVMAYGKAFIIQDREQKLRAMDSFIDRFFPGRSKAIRQPTELELKATSILGMEMEEAAGKIRDLEVHDEEEDYAVPVWTALIPVKTVLEPVVECPRQHPDATIEAGGMADWQPGRRLDELLLEMYRKEYPEG